MKSFGSLSSAKVKALAAQLINLFRFSAARCPFDYLCRCLICFADMITAIKLQSFIFSPWFTIFFSILTLQEAHPAVFDAKLSHIVFVACSDVIKDAD